VAAERNKRRAANGSAAAKAAALRPDGGLPADANAADEPPAGARPHRSRGRRWVLSILVLLVLGGLLAAGGVVAYRWSQEQYYVAADGGSVAIYRGVEQKLAWISLSAVHERAPVTVDALPSYYRSQVDNSIPARDLTDAHRIVANLKAQADACAAQQQTPPTPTRTPTPTATPTSPVAAPRSAAATRPSPAPSLTPRPPRVDCPGVNP
jgi:protein phosphatase